MDIEKTFPKSFQLFVVGYDIRYCRKKVNICFQGQSRLSYAPFNSIVCTLLSYLFLYKKYLAYAMNLGHCFRSIEYTAA